MASIEPHAMAGCLFLAMLLAVEQGGLADLGLMSVAASLACVPPASHMCNRITNLTNSSSLHLAWTYIQQQPYIFTARDRPTAHVCSGLSAVVPRICDQSPQAVQQSLLCLAVNVLISGVLDVILSMRW